MSLVLDNRAGLAGKPGLHALIVGVSGYPHLPVPGAGAPPAEAFGMYQLSSTSLAAYRVYRWLLDEAQGLPVPLATCRLLLSPSADELAAEGHLAGLGSASTVDNFLVDAAGWRTDASSSDDNMTLFY